MVEGAVCNAYTHCLRDLLILKALEVTMLVHAVDNCAALWFYPALCHKIQLCVQIYSLHLCVIFIICGEAKRQKRFIVYSDYCLDFCLELDGHPVHPGLWHTYRGDLNLLPIP